MISSSLTKIFDANPLPLVLIESLANAYRLSNYLK
jgi:hypothetical protein